MTGTIDKKFECPNGNSRCDSRRFMTVYENYGMKSITVPLCISTLPMKYSFLDEFPGIGIEKMCRRDLYNKIGAVSFLEK